MLHCTAGVGRDQVIGHEMTLTLMGTGVIEHFPEFHKRPGRWLVHQGKDFFLGMLRCQFDLAGNMVADQLFDITLCVFLICQDQVWPDSGGNKDLFDSADAPDLIENLQL